VLFLTGHKKIRSGDGAGAALSMVISLSAKRRRFVKLFLTAVLLCIGYKSYGLRGQGKKSGAIWNGLREEGRSADGGYRCPGLTI
jgi:hypothetical protein